MARIKGAVIPLIPVERFSLDQKIIEKLLCQLIVDQRDRRTAQIGFAASQTGRIHLNPKRAWLSGLLDQSGIGTPPRQENQAHLDLCIHLQPRIIFNIRLL